MGLALGLPGGCAGAPRPDRTEPLTRDGVHSEGGRADETSDAGNADKASPLGRTPLAAPRDEPLAVTVLPVATERWALLVHEDPEANAAHLRVAWPDGRLGAVRTLVGRHVVGGYDAGRPLLLSSDGERLCLEPLDGAPTAPRCHAARAELAATLGDGVALLSERPADGPPGAGTGSRQGGSATAAPTRRQRPPRKGKPGGRHGAAAHHPRRAAAGGAKRRGKPTAPEIERIAVWLQRADLTGGALSEPVDTGLRLARPMPAMGLVDAIGAGAGVRLLWYEHAPSRRRGRQRVARARLRTGALDAAGKLRAATVRTLLLADRRYGGLTGHLAPQLFGRGDRVAWLGWQLEPRHRRGGPEGRLLAPSAPLDVPLPLYAVLPAALLASDGGKGSATAAAAILARAPGRARWQLGRAAARVAWTGSRGWTLIDGALHGVDRKSGRAAPLPAPLLGHRARLHWGFVEPDGRGLALGSDGLREIEDNGTVLGRGAPDRPEASARPIGRVVRIGPSWWMLRPAAGAGAGAELRRLLPTPAAAAAPLGRVNAAGTALVGGERSGLVLQVVGRRLAVWRLGAGGATRLLGRYRSPVQAGFAAVARTGGGAMVAGVGGDGRAVVAAVDERGVLLAVRPSRIELAAGRVRMAALPGGGAWLSDARGQRVAWYDEQARELGLASWPDERVPAACIDGRPARPLQPGVTPGQLVLVAELGRPGTCLWGTAAWLPGGRLRWVGGRVAGLDASAEVVTTTMAALETGERAARRAERGHTARTQQPAPGSEPSSSMGGAEASADKSSAPCPGDMVLVAGGLCVDRYESRLVDAASGVALSPDYPTRSGLLLDVLKAWTLGRYVSGDLRARAMPLPPLLRAADASPLPLARSLPGVRPSGYISGLVARQACKRAGKRLCTKDEWRRACRGQGDTHFPYGESFERTACNVYRYHHPARILHGNAAIGHLDPRLDRVEVEGEPLLRRTGGSRRCASRWGDDAIYDMVGNLDEWVDDKGGAFAGGFYARATRAGCGALISVHPWRYLDYSLGVRCCLGAQR